MSNIKLKPCPFCKKEIIIGKDFEIRPNQIWTGMRYQVNHYELNHWCNGSGMLSTKITMKAKTQEELFEMWNGE